MSKPIDLEQDIQPLSEFRANAAAFIERVRETKCPLVITQHGRSAVVVMDVGEYERLMDRIEKLEILEDIQAAEKDYAEGRFSDHETVKQRLLERFKP